MRLCAWCGAQLGAGGVQGAGRRAHSTVQSTQLHAEGCRVRSMQLHAGCRAQLGAGRRVHGTAAYRVQDTVGCRVQGA